MTCSSFYTPILNLKKTQQTYDGSRPVIVVIPLTAPAWVVNVWSSTWDRSAPKVTVGHDNIGVEMSQDSCSNSSSRLAKKKREKHHVCN